MSQAQTFTETLQPASLAAVAQARSEVEEWLGQLTRCTANYYMNLQPATLRFKQMLIDFDKQAQSISRDQFYVLFGWLALNRFMLECLKDESKQGCHFQAASALQHEFKHKLENDLIPDFDPCSDFVFFLRTLIDAVYPLVSEPPQER